jgi:hypothetical protein
MTRTGAMKTVVLIPDGVGVRNFLFGPFLRDVSSRGHAYVLHVIPPERVNLYAAGLNGNVDWAPLLPHQETAVPFTLRYSLAYAQMYWAGTRSMRHNLTQPVRGSWRTRASHKAARLIGRMAACPAAIRVLDRVHCRAVDRSAPVMHYRRMFEWIRPSVLFCSHQRPPEVLAPVLAARSLGIPTATFIFSWDNITSKGRIAAPFDYYLVWSELMRKELMRYYPDISPERIHIVGTPQFDPYADPDVLWPREEFFRRVGADPSRRLICYSGGDLGNCPEDPLHVRILMQAIRDGRIRGNPQVLLRPAPVDDGSRYDPVHKEFPELIVALPAWVQTVPAQWSRVIPLPSDVQFLASLTQHADLNINLGSTMTLDFAIHDKPVVNIAFDVASPPPFGIPLWDFHYQFEHYTAVVKLGAARFARSADELVEHVNAYLDNPALDADARRRLTELQVGVPIGEASRRIRETLELLAR